MQNKYDIIMERIKSYYILGEKHLVPSEDDIRHFEQRIGFRIPSDYRHFLAKYGLSAGSNITRFHNVNDAVEETSPVEVFYGLKPGDTYDLKDNWDIFKDDLPRGFLAIASSPGGQIVLSLTGGDAGKVFWWAQHRGSQDPYDDLELIANDFNAFINTLASYEE